MDENTATAPAAEEPRKSSWARLREITDSIEAGIKDLFSSEKYMDYLRTMSKFHNYSFNNTMLIHMQMPEATRVASYSTWQDRFHRRIKRGERGIKIIAPTPYVKTVEAVKRDPETDAPLVDQNGEVIMEEKKIRLPRFKVVTVFDVSQTYGQPLPQLASALTGDVHQFDIFMEALRRSSPVPVELKPLPETLDGFFNGREQSITIREGMSEAQTVCAAIHEIAHSILHNTAAVSEEKMQSAVLFGKPALFTEKLEGFDRLPDGLYAYQFRGGTVILGEPLDQTESGQLNLGENLRFTGGETSMREFWETVCPDRANKSRRTQEVEAESIAFSVSAYYGIETGENSFGYIASWSSGKELAELRASLQTINRTSGELIKDIDRNFDIICRERGISRGPKKADPAKLDEYPMPDPSADPKQFQKAGIEDADLLPVTRARALELMDAGFPVYGAEDRTVRLCADSDEIRNAPGAALFGVDRREWEHSPLFRDAVEARLSRQEEREAAFMSRPDSFAIYQLQHSQPLEPLRFLSYDELGERGASPSRNMYDLVYTAELGNKSLDDIFFEFNTEIPADYRSYSLSASDIIGLNREGTVTYHYVDRIGFRELPDFNPLKNAEMALEDDYNMVDGIINNGPRQPAHAEAPGKRAEAGRAEIKAKSMSIYEQLRQTVPQRPAAPKKQKSRGPEL